MYFVRTAVILSLMCVFTLPTEVFANGEENSVEASGTDASDSWFTVDNFLTLPHPKVAFFSVFEDGNASGVLESGTIFTQVNVVNDLGIRVQQFQIDDHRHFIIEGTIAYTLKEFSVELARAYNEKQNMTEPPSPPRRGVL